MTDINKKARQQALEEFREKHLGQLEKTIEVWIEIRDDAEAKDKDRLEAGKNIARLLAAMQPDKTITKATGILEAKEFIAKKPQLSPKLRKKLEQIQKYGMERDSL